MDALLKAKGVSDAPAKAVRDPLGRRAVGVAGLRREGCYLFRRGIAETVDVGGLAGRSLSKLPIDISQLAN